jgi:hypothetical protein
MELACVGEKRSASAVGGDFMAHQQDPRDPKAAAERQSGHSDYQTFARKPTSDGGADRNRAERGDFRPAALASTLAAVDNSRLFEPARLQHSERWDGMS